MNLIDYFAYILSGAFTDDYAKEIREAEKRQAEKRLEEDKENDKE